MNPKSGLRRGAILGAMVALVGNGWLFVWVSSSSSSWGMPLRGSEFMVLFATAALILALISPVLTLFIRTRPVGLALLAGSLIYVVTFLIALRGGGAIRMRGFERFAVRSQPLINAIEKYSAELGNAPATLKELVPDFLAEIPSTGVGSAPDYLYIVGEMAQRRYHGNPWVLQLDVGIGTLNWDILIYYPLQNYPDYGHGGVLEPVEGWAYVHE